MVHFRGWASIICFALVWGVAAEAHAQNWSTADPSAAHVAIYTGAGTTRLRLVPEGGKEPIADCIGLCDFAALPGRYTLYTHDASTGADHELSLRIRRSSRFQLQQGDNRVRDAGLALGITGSVSIFAGLIMTLPIVLSSMCEDSNCTSSDERLTAEIGLGLMLGGIIATPLGFSLFSHNRTKLTLIDQSPYEANNSGPSLRLGLVGVNSGLGLGGVGTF